MASGAYTNMTILGLFFSSFFIGFSGAMMPGPVLSVTIAETIRRGFVASSLIVLGHGIVELAWMIALSMGIAKLSTGSAATAFISIAGGLILAWMGVTMGLNGLRGAVLPLSARQSEGRRSLGPIVLGGVTSASNPYWYLWWATVGAAYISRARASGLGLAGSVAFFSGHILSDLVWYSAVGLMVVLGRTFLSDRVYKGLLVLCGLFMLGMGISFIWYGVLRS